MAANTRLCHTARIAILSLLASIGAPAAAMAAGHHHHGMAQGLDGLDGGLGNAFAGSERVVDKELSSMRGGSININGTNITFTIAQNVSTFNPITNTTQIQQFVFSSANVQPTSIAQVATATSLTTTPMVVTQNISQGVVNLNQVINATVQTSFGAATVTRSLTQALSNNIFAIHH